jgi:hypothetical protein
MGAATWARMAAGHLDEATPHVTALEVPLRVAFDPCRDRRRHCWPASSKGFVQH